MTLIVGIKCTDGIVLGADGAATFGMLGHRTIRQSVSKLHILENCIVIGVSGPIGLGQRIVGEIEDLWKGNKLSGKKPYEAMKVIRDAIWEKHIGPELHAASIAKNAIGAPAMDSAIAATLAALPISKTLCLFQFDQQAAPEEATDDLPFISIGSGQDIADPFLAFLRRIFWPNTLPSLNAGVFAAVWTLEHAIQTNAGGVADPKQIIVLKKQGKDCKARELPQEELEEHLEAIKAAETKLANFQQQPTTMTAEAEDIPPPPI